MTKAMMAPAEPGTVLKQSTHIGASSVQMTFTLRSSILHLLFVPSEQLGKRTLRLFLLCNSVINGGRG